MLGLPKGGASLAAAVYKINTKNLTLTLFVARLGRTDNANGTFTLHNFAATTDFFD
jgi:hypothetical protein